MTSEDGESWRFSPLAVAGGALSFVISNRSLLAKWALAPMAFGVLYHLLMPSKPVSPDASGATVLVMLALGFLLLWVRVPLDVRLYRKALLSETPSSFYGMQLLEGCTWRYLGTYFKIGVAYLGGAFLPGMLLAAVYVVSGPAAAKATEGWQQAVGPVVYALAICAVGYIWLAPRAVMLFADTAVGGSMRLFGRNPSLLAACEARWRIVAVMFLIWLPEYAGVGLNLLGDSLGWWENQALALGFSVCSYFLGFATALVSMAAGAGVYARLQGRPEPAPEELEEA
ncbi:hypothetical protein [Fundidesulfovibrio agrisoli]|uniref:hypothetical protein n=1 Tax=Fundidesulfovibrio agrisoli TaxID=2922717 RepID=UPI001FAC5BB7|nr:hypothetical protein [Fundidesulfovibrio agrisoli]